MTWSASTPPAAPSTDSLASACPPLVFPVLAGSQSWWRQSQFLALMAVTGWASQRALIEELARRSHIFPGAGSLKRLLSGLVKLKLIKKHRLPAAGSTAVMLTLSEFGHQVVAAMGLTVTESEWDRLSHLRPKTAPEHAALICLFAAAARARGYSTQVCPKTENNIFVDIRGQRSTDKPELVFIEPEVEISAQPPSPT